MGSIATKTSICNLAMGWLRANLLSNIDTDTSVEAKLCRANYDRIREAVLEDREWRFATRRAKLEQNIDQPVFGWSHKYKLPADCVRVLTCTDSAARAADPKTCNDIDWEREEDFVVSNRASCYIRYTANIEITNKFSPGFVQAFAKRIASELCVSLTGSSKRSDNLAKEYEKLVARGGTRDGMQGKARKRMPGRLETARYRGGGGFDVITDV